ncbi:MAG: hydrogenase maturation protease [Dehalococcoidia bacterium]|nr:hydrogenase maturation protease [Dehalococcoidia bacterium]
MKTVILGLGNPILTDDGVGNRIAAEVKRELESQGPTVLEASLGGIRLLDILASYERAIIIDSIMTGSGQPGRIHRLEAKDFDSARHTSSSHDVSFSAALEFGQKIGMVLPRKIDIFAVEVMDVNTFGETCTPEVERAIPICAAMVLEVLGESCEE